VRWGILAEPYQKKNRVPNTPATLCPICRGTTAPFDKNRPGLIEISCENCGQYYTSCEVILEGYGNSGLGSASPDDRAQLAGWIRDRWRRGEKNITVLTYDLKPILQSAQRLSPAEKANHLLTTIARASGRPGIEIPRANVRYTDAWALDPAELTVYLIWLLERQFVTPYAGTDRIALTLTGWVEVNRLERQRAVNATLAFMAMPFGVPRIDRLVNEFFIPAAKAAGYELRRLTDGQPAGLIDDQLRVRLRTARFVVADLTDNNRGAYWEAGFAEGLGTPVIYSCERAVFDSDDRKNSTHFDTNHLVTVLWNENNLQAAADELKTRIRATLPTEAKLED
jgi:hypothetical protein